MSGSLPIDTNLANADLIPSQSGPPFSLFAEWRKSDPVHWNPPPENYGAHLVGASMKKGFWVLTRYDDVVEVSRDPSRFCSHVGSPIIWDFEPEQLSMQQAGLMGMPIEQHAFVKRLALPPFAGKELAKWEGDIQAVAKSIIDDIAPRGECEFVFEVASKLPIYSFCKVMGVPDDMRERVAALGNDIADTEKPREFADGEVPPAFQLFEIASQLAAMKRENPDDSILSTLVHAEDDGQKLDEMNINMFVLTLSIAGHETTRNTAAHFVRLMNEHPDQYELLRRDPEKYLPNAIEEVLRISPPVIQFRRTVLEDTEIGGQPVKKGDKIYMSYPAANRDPAIFEDPNRFDITREDANRHLSFGIGPHVCIGARLAHMQLKALLKEIVTRIPDIRIAGDLKYLRSIWFSGILEMPVKFTPES